MPKLIMLVGPPGSGKSFKYEELSKDITQFPEHIVRVSQDDHGKVGHLDVFNGCLLNKLDICIDRMNFNKVQRERYLEPAKKLGYETEIIVLHENYDTCLARCLKREGHPTIKDEDNAKSALNMFFSKYERVQDDEADVVTRVWPEGAKDLAVICDLDGTLCNIDHRLHFVRKVEGKRPDWKNFFYNIPGDKPNGWCDVLLDSMADYCEIIYCSGRPDNYRKLTEEWLHEYQLGNRKLFMRNRHDSRKDSIAKEIIYEFEIKTRWKVLFCIDDRQQVVDMWRNHGLVCLQCAPGDF